MSKKVRFKMCGKVEFVRWLICSLSLWMVSLRACGADVFVLWEVQQLWWKLRKTMSRVARRFIFVPKIPIWVYFGGPWNGECWCILWTFGQFYRQMIYFITIWYTYFVVLWYISPVLKYCSKKIWQPLAAVVVVSSWKLVAVLLEGSC
jgi:hypothetical protein